MTEKKEQSSALHRGITKMRQVPKKLVALHKKSADSVRTKAASLQKQVLAHAVRSSKRVHALWHHPTFRTIRITTYATIAVVCTVLVVTIGLFSFYSLSFDTRILVKVKVPGADLSGLTPDQAYHLLETNYATLAARGIPFVVEGNRYVVPIESLGISYDLGETVARAYRIGHTGDFWRDQYDRLKALLVTQQIVDPAEIVHQDAVEQGIRSFIPEVREAAQNADVVVQDNTFVIVPSRMGTTTDFAYVTKQIETALQTFEPHDIVLSIEDDYPVITDEEAARAVSVAEDFAKQTLTLRAHAEHDKERIWEIALAKNKNWIAFAADGSLLRPTIAQAALREYLESEVAKQVNQTRSDATIFMPEGESRFAKLEGNAMDGYAVLVEDTIRQVKMDVESGRFESNVQIAFDPGKVLTPDGKDVGLKDLLAVGRSNFANSPAGRAYNIGYGLSKYNGLLIEPGETFSFNAWLGPVDAAHGWKEALAIFNGGDNTEPVAGGGLCQVSTTIYRAALYAGLPITARKPHSFYVSYYAAFGDGLDATVYTPNPDLQFVNDTGNYILIQAYTEGTDAYVRFYGTSDGRAVEMQGPVKSAWQSPGPANITASTELAPGEEKQTLAAHPGRRITWKQIITYPDGKKVENDIVSQYRAVPAQIKRGVAVLVQSEASEAPPEVIL